MALRRDVAVLDFGRERRQTHVAFGFLTGLVSLDFGLMIVLSCFRI